MILKAGTYRWIDKPDLSLPFSQDISFTVDLGGDFGVMEGNRIFNDYSSTTNELATGLSLNVGMEGDYMPIPIYAVAGTGFIWFDGEDSFGDGIHYITITNDSDVSDTFGEIFIANTNYNEVNAPKITLKAGTYKWNVTPTPNTHPLTGTVLLGDAEKVYYDFVASVSVGESSAISSKLYIVYIPIDDVPSLYEMGYVGDLYQDGTLVAENVEVPIYNHFNIETDGTGWLVSRYSSSGATIENLTSFTLSEDITVDEQIGNYILSNTDYEIVNQSLAKITYNGETFLLEAGDKATIPCAELKMRTDVVVKVNEFAGGGASDLIINSGNIDNSIVGEWKLNKLIDTPLVTITTQEEFIKYTDGEYNIPINAYTEYDGVKHYWEFLSCVLLNGTFDDSGEIVTYENFLQMMSGSVSYRNGRRKYEYDEEFEVFDADWDDERCTSVIIEDDINSQKYEQLFRSCGIKINPLETISTQDGTFKVQNIDASLYGKHLYRHTFRCNFENAPTGYENTGNMVIINNDPEGFEGAIYNQLKCTIGFEREGHMYYFEVFHFYQNGELLYFPYKYANAVEWLTVSVTNKERISTEEYT